LFNLLTTIQFPKKIRNFEPNFFNIPSSHIKYSENTRKIIKQRFEKRPKRNVTGAKAFKPNWNLLNIHTCILFFLF